jgi:hypothetical protein
VAAAPGDIVAAYGTAQQRAVTQTLTTAQRLWRELSTADLVGSWVGGVGGALVRAVAAGQLLAASTGQPYVDAMVAADGLTSDYAEGSGRVSARAFSGAAADGRPLDSLLYMPVIRTKTLLAGGVTLQEAMTGGLVSLQRMVASEVADAGRGAAGVAMVANRQVTGYVRVVQSGACARCVILAGRWYAYNAGFQRHPHCQCYAMAATNARVSPRTDPMGFFDSLSTEEQNRRFGLGGAEAIRNGGDIYSVVNASRSTVTLDAYGQKVVATLEGTTRHGQFYRSMLRDTEQRTGQRFARSFADVKQGLPQFQLRTPRLTPGEIYRLSEDRDELIRMLGRFGYLS